MFEHLQDPRPPGYDDNRRVAVHARAARLRERARRQRRGVGAAVAVVVLVGVAAVLSEREGPVEVVAASDQSSTTTISTAPVVADTTTTPPDTAPVTVVETTSVPATAPPPSTEPPVPVVACSRTEPFQPYSYPENYENYENGYDNARVEVRATLDRAVVAPGEALTITFEAHNPTPEEINVIFELPGALIRGESGDVYWYSGHVLPGAGGYDDPGSATIDANGSLFTNHPWPSEFCSNESHPDRPFAPGRLAPGFYTVETRWFGQVNELPFEVR